MTIKFIKEENRAVAYNQELEIGECIFNEMSDTWIILHTGVDDAYRGKGIAKELVKCVRKNAIRYNKKLAAECSYAKKILEENVTTQKEK